MARILIAPIEVTGAPELRAETLWLMRRAQRKGLIEFSGVVVVQFLAGYSGFPGQSRILRVVTRRCARCDWFQNKN